MVHIKKIHSFLKIAPKMTSKAAVFARLSDQHVGSWRAEIQ